MTSDPSEHADPVTVAVFVDRGEAEVAHAKLRSFGIEAVLLDEAEGGALPVGDDQGVQVQVRAADADDARAVLAEPSDA
jgi:hypothetical protein